MVLENGFSQRLTRKMRIDFGGADRLVTQQGLDNAEIGTTF
jgi:hypothetical protein